MVARYVIVSAMSLESMFNLSLFEFMPEDTATQADSLLLKLFPYTQKRWPENHSL